MKCFLYMLLSLALQNSYSLILQSKPSPNSMPESKKLEVRFKNDGSLTEIFTSHTPIKIDDRNSIHVKVNGKNPYIFEDNIDPYNVAFDKVYEASKANPEQDYILNHQPMNVTEYMVTKNGVQTDEVLIDPRNPQFSYYQKNNGSNPQDNASGITYNEFHDDNSINQGHIVTVPADGSNDAENLATHLETALNNANGNGTVQLDPELVKAIVNNLNKLEHQPEYEQGDLNDTQVTNPDIIALTQTNSELRDRLFHLHQKIEEVSNEISMLQSQGHTDASHALEFNRAELMVEEKQLDIEIKKEEDLQYREDVDKAERERVEMIQLNSNDEEMASIDDKIGTLESNLAYLDEDIKKEEIEMLDIKLNQLEGQENTATDEKRAEIHEKEVILIDQEIQVSENHQVENELEADVETTDEKIAEIDGDYVHTQEIRKLKQVRRKLKDLARYIESEDTNVDKQVKDKKDHLESQDIGNSDHLTLSTQIGYTDNHSETLSIDETIDHIDQSQLTQSDDDTLLNIKKQLEVHVHTSFIHIPLMIDLLTKIHVNFKSTFSELPSKPEDIPKYSYDNSEQLIAIYKTLIESITSFDLNKKMLIDYCNDLKSRIERIDFDGDGVLEFYELSELVDLIRNNIRTPNKLYFLKLEDIHIETELIAMKLIDIRKAIESILKLETWIEYRISIIRTQINLPGGPGDVEMLSIAAGIAPKFVTARNDVETLTDEIKKEFSIIEERRAKVVKMVDVLDELSGRDREHKQLAESQLDLSFQLQTNDDAKILNDDELDEKEHNPQLSIIDHHLETDYHIENNWSSIIKGTAIAISIILMLL